MNISAHESSRLLCFAALALLILPSSPLPAMHAHQAAENIGYRSNTAFCASASGSVSKGESTEYAYSGGKTLSRLQWEMNPAAMFGITAEALFPYTYTAGVSLLASFPAETGHMQDTDYGNLNGIPTEYSRHSCRTNRNVSADMYVAKTFIFGDIKLMLFPGLLYRSIRFTAHGGYYQYPAGSAKVPMSGKIMSLDETIFVPYAGTRAAFRLSGRYTVSFAGYFSPCASCRNTDSHYLRDREFHDSMFFGLYAAAQASAAWSFDRTFSAFVQIDLSRFFETRGRSYYRDTKTGIQSASGRNTAGSSLTELSISAGMTAMIRPFD